MTNIIEIIKTAAVEAVATSNPTAVVFGLVKSVNPLKIEVEQKLILESTHLVLTTLVSDFEVDMTVDYSTENTSGNGFESHNHSITGKKKGMIHLGLQEGETVILLQVQGGQRYIVLDRVR